MVAMTGPTEPRPEAEALEVDRTDPVLMKRARVARLVRFGIRAGSGLFALATVLFFVALVVGFTSFYTTTIAICLIVGSVILAPSMVFNYAVKAADRADREGSW